MKNKFAILILLAYGVFLTGCASAPKTEFFYDKQEQSLHVYYPSKGVEIKIPQGFEMLQITPPCCVDISFTKDDEGISVPFLHFLFTNADFSELIQIVLSSDFNLTNDLKAKDYFEIETEIEDYFSENSVEDYMFKSFSQIPDEDLPDGDLPGYMQIFGYQTIFDFIEAFISAENDQVILGNIISISADYTLGPFQTYVEQSMFNNEPVHLIVSYISKIDSKSNYEEYLRTIFFESTVYEPSL